jgi:hypothetical protein
MARPRKNKRGGRKPSTTKLVRSKRPYATLTSSPSEKGGQQSHHTQLANKAVNALQNTPMPPDEEEELESWLDWGLELVKEWGPVALEAVPGLLALL